MSDEELDRLLDELLNAIDYDIAKQYNVETAEEPEFAESAREELLNIIRKHTG